MYWRISLLVISHVIGIGLAWWLLLERNDLVGALVALFILAVGATSWLVWDAWLSLRVLRWLRSGTPEPQPWASNLWGEVVEASRRNQRRLRRQAQESQEKLAVFLEALQASPIGVS